MGWDPGEGREGKGMEGGQDEGEVIPHLCKQSAAAGDNVRKATYINYAFSFRRKATSE